MNDTNTSKFNVKKLLLGILAVVLAVLLVVMGIIFAIWHNELITVSSIKMVRPRNDAHLDGGVYTMHVKGDYYFPEFIEQGGVKNDEELIEFITNGITKGIIPMHVESPEIGCSSFTAVSKDGDALFARNYDFSQTNTCIVFTDAKDDRHATISTADLQFLGIEGTKDLDFMDKVLTLAAVYTPLDGINDAGLTCGIYMTYQGDETVATDQNTEKPDITSTTFMRMILDYAETVDEAVAIAEKYDMHDSAVTSFHIMVADPSGKSAILEWTGDTDSTDNDGSKRELKVIYSDDDDYIGELEGKTDYQVVTNFILQPGYYEGSTEDDIKGRDRYDEIYSELNRTNGVVEDEKAAMDILEIVGRRNWKNDDNNGCTVHSAVYNMTDKTVLWVPNENFDDESAYFEFGF